MTVLYAFLLMMFLVGLGLMAPIASAKTPRLRQIFFVASLVLVNGGALIALGLGYLVTRLEGSIPPTLLDFLGSLWLPIALLILVDVATVVLFERKRPLK